MDSVEKARALVGIQYEDHPPFVAVLGGTRLGNLKSPYIGRQVCTVQYMTPMDAGTASFISSKVSFRICPVKHSEDGWGPCGQNVDL